MLCISASWGSMLSLMIAQAQAEGQEAEGSRSLGLFKKPKFAEDICFEGMVVLGR